MGDTRVRVFYKAMDGFRLGCVGGDSGGFVPGCSLRGYAGSGFVRWFCEGSIKRKKGIWWMPWHREAMKDVADCEKLRGIVSKC